jgi:hypothetical protein
LSIYSNSDIFIGKIIVIILLYLLRRKILLVTTVTSALFAALERCLLAWAQGLNSFQITSPEPSGRDSNGPSETQQLS